MDFAAQRTGRSIGQLVPLRLLGVSQRQSVARLAVGSAIKSRHSEHHHHSLYRLQGLAGQMSRHTRKPIQNLTCASAARPVNTALQRKRTPTH